MTAIWNLKVRDELIEGEWLEDYAPLVRIYTVLATHENGERFAYRGPFAIKSADHGLRLISRIRQWERDSGEIFDPTDRELWINVEPCYGSREWQRQDMDAFLLRQEREDEMLVR